MISLSNFLLVVCGSCFCNEMATTYSALREEYYFSDSYGFPKRKLCDIKRILYMNISQIWPHKALIVEVTALPKPGLVDRFNCGTHCNMDIFTFTDSVTAIRLYFYLCASAGGIAKNPALLLPQIREYGLKAECAMLVATNSVNTHKGAIFTLGILSIAAIGIASLIKDDEITEEYAIPGAFDPRVAEIVSKAVAEKAIELGLNRI